jgi:hypothetical protein
MDFLTNMGEKRKSASPCAILKKNRRKTIGTEEKLDAISRSDKVNELSTYAVMLDFLIVVYIQFGIMLTELKKVQSQELKCLCRNTTTVLSE